MAVKGSATAAAGSAKAGVTKAKAVKKARAPAVKQIDFDKQCGVELPNGAKCGRLLTCKTHSVSAKRAVQGRSRPFDALLATYRQTRQVQNARASQIARDVQEEKTEEAPLPEHEEIQQVLVGTLQSHAMPLHRRVTYPVRSRHRYLNVRELLLGSINRVPPLPTSQNSDISQLMTSTGAVLGRSVIFSPVTGSQYMRQARVYRDPEMLSRLQAASKAAQSTSAAAAAAARAANSAAPSTATNTQ